jgi:hypothetical protein
LRLVETHGVTHTQLVPTMFVRMLKLPREVHAHPGPRALPSGRPPRGARAVERSLALFGPTSTLVGRLYALVYLCWAGLVEGDLLRARAMGWQARLMRYAKSSQFA